ncbi:MAG: hypothetical protein WBA57_19370 [Elainellaceae cyanobacterium]
MKTRRLWITFIAPAVLGTCAVALSQWTNPSDSEQLTAQTQVDRSEQREMGQRRHRRPDFAAAATQLGVSEEALIAALGVPAEPPSNGERHARPDFAAAAAELGVSQEDLMDALHSNRPEGAEADERGGHRRPDFAAAATQLGVSEAALIAALGVPAERPSNGERHAPPDFAAAAAELGVSQEDLMEAMQSARLQSQPGSRQ